MLGVRRHPFRIMCLPPSTFGRSWQAINVAISMVAVNASRLRSWLGVRDEDAVLPLWCSGTTVCVTFADSERAKSGSSGSAAAALSLICVLARRSLKAETLVITGTMDLTGAILDVGGLDGKIQHAFEKVGTWAGFTAVMHP